jgi:ABC-type multidrug transport system fused ATPase/permease subunit
MAMAPRPTTVVFLLTALLLLELRCLVLGGLIISRDSEFYFPTYGMRLLPLLQFFLRRNLIETDTTSFRPKDSILYQVVVLICLILLILQRTVNVLAPLQLGVLVDNLGKGTIPYREIILYVVYRGLQGNQGILGAARSVLWIPVSQSLFRRLSSAAFEHVLGLSLDFHLNKKIGEVTSALSRGAAMNTFLESFCFQVFPMVFDIFLAGVIFFVKYDAFYTIIIFFIMWSYIFLTIYVAKYRGKQRRDMATKLREMEAVKTDAIIAYETVQHNCAVPRETKRFKDHVVFYQVAERLVQWSLNGLNLTQSSIFTLGTALLVAVSAYKINIGEQTVGEFVSLINYFVQLQGPLNFFGTYYTMLQNNLIEAERMLDLVSLRRTPFERHLLIPYFSLKRPRVL